MSGIKQGGSVPAFDVSTILLGEASPRLGKHPQNPVPTMVKRFLNVTRPVIKP